MPRCMRLQLGFLLLAGVVLAGGCDGNAEKTATAPSVPVDSGVSSPQSSVGSASSEATSSASESTRPRAIPKISLAATPETMASGSLPPESGSSPAGQQDDAWRAVVVAMHPLQVMLGTWKGTTQREFGDFKALDKPAWVWDFQTDRSQPALVMTSTDSPYIRQGRLTYLPETEVFRFTIEDAEGKTRTLEGTFRQAVREFQGDDQKMHVAYELELTQTDAESPRDQWQIVFNQQENNRYLLEMARNRSNRFLRYDTVATQREGTSFGTSDEGYGERECIISGGLGTMQVSYKGRSYWVCCTGCQAAFNDDPESWLASMKKEE